MHVPLKIPMGRSLGELLQHRCGKAGVAPHLLKLSKRLSRDARRGLVVA